MSQRLVAIIDADLKLAGHLQTELQRYGLTVEVAADSNDLMARKEELPELVVLCIDPKRTGWAVCNRLRKSPLLKSIPLIITSAEATEKDFDDHKKLKTRAEEYLHKPFSAEALIDKIGTLIGLPQVETDGGEIEVEAEELSAADLEADDVAVEVAEEIATADDAGEEEHTRVGLDSEIDGEVDLETNAAFAAIGLDEPAESTTREASGVSPFDEEPFAPEPPATSSSDPDMDSAPVPRVAAESLDLGLDEVARDAAALVSSSPSPVPQSAVLDEAQREIERLRRENEELRARPAATGGSTSSFSREREFLNLRETINKKEKEILDLRDALDSKERQILDGKDRLREAERKLREHDEHSLGTERDLVASREKIEALGADKERGVERERQLKGRLEEAQKTTQRAEAEVEQLRGRHAADVSAADERHSQTVAKHREELAAARQSHADAVAAAEEAHANEQVQLREEHAEATNQLVAQHKQALEAELRATERKQAEALVDLETKHEQTMQAASARHEEALRLQVEEGKRTLEQAVQDQLGERARLEAEHAEAVEALDQAKSEELAEMASQAAEKLAAAVAQRGVEAEAELKTVREQSARKLQALEESHEDLRAGMNARHAAAVDELKRQHGTAIDERETMIAERDTVVAQLHEQVSELEATLKEAEQQSRTQGETISEISGQLEASNTELEARARTLEERARRVAELEQESARYQDQILRAYQRIKADESIVARAKKALAIALTLLEESDTEGGEEASS
jgi:CheY-like chemotaxis protein